MTITWLGQSGYLLGIGDQRLLIDPFFSEVVERKQGVRRLVPPPCTIASLAPDLLFITHDHLDHYDPETVVEIMTVHPGCRLIGPSSVMAHAARDGIPATRLLSIVPGGTIACGSVSLTATPAQHSDPVAVGLLLKAFADCVWFSGDTLYFPELAARARLSAGRSPDLAFICINGRLGNMNVQEAARVIAELRPRVAVPMHYGMFAENTADPAEFVTCCAGLGRRAIALSHGAAIDSNVLLRDDAPRILIA